MNLTILWFQLSNDLSQEIAPICKKVKGADFGMDTPLSPTNSETGESLFELYLAVQEFIRFVSGYTIKLPSKLKSYFYFYLKIILPNTILSHTVVSCIVTIIQLVQGRNIV